MKALIYRGVGQFKVEDVPETVIPGPEWVKVKVRAAGLCGSDIHRLLHERPRSDDLKVRILGHEVAGVIVECGNEVAGFRKGDRVAVEPLLPCGHCSQCDRGSWQLCLGLRCIGRELPGGFSEFLSVRQDQIHVLPAGVSFSEGALIDLIAVGVHCLNSLSPDNRNWSVAIVGDGPLALILLQLARTMTAGPIVVFGKYDYLLKLALALGASQAIISSTKQSRSTIFADSFDVVIEAVGGRQSMTLQSCIELVAPGGTIAVLGVFDFGFLGAIPLRRAFCKEIKIFGVNSYSVWEGVREFDKALRLLSAGSVDVEQLISHRLPLARFQEALDIVKKKQETGVIKVVIEP